MCKCRLSRRLIVIKTKRSYLTFCRPVVLSSMVLGSMISILRSFPAYGSSRIWQFTSGMKARGNLAFWDIICTGFDSFCQPSMETHHSHAHSHHMPLLHKSSINIRNIKHSWRQKNDRKQWTYCLAAEINKKRISKECNQNQRIFSVSHQKWDSWLELKQDKRNRFCSF